MLEETVMQPTIPPPILDPRRPTALVIPPLACDSHCHVFGPASRFPYAEDRSYTPPDAGFEGLQRLHGTLGFERAVIVQASCHGTDNSALSDALERGAGAYAGVAMIDASTSDSELERLHVLGVRGARFNFVAHLGAAPELSLFNSQIARIAKLGWHAVLHFDARDLPAYGKLLDSLAVPYIIDHIARVEAAAGLDQVPFQSLLDRLRDEKCWVKISGPERVSSDGRAPFLDVVPFVKEVVATAPGRVLWGTDWPHPNVRTMPDDGDLVDFLATAIPDRGTRTQILVDNPQVLYDFAD